MKPNLITSIATRRNPAIAGIPSCAVMAKRLGFKRPEKTIPSFGGAGFGYPTYCHSWDLGTRVIREGRYMA
jgi:hypothetical protein